MKNDSYDVSTIRARSSVYMSCDLYDGIHRNQNEVLILLIFLLVPIRAFKETVRCYKKLSTYIYTELMITTNGTNVNEIR